MEPLSVICIVLGIAIIVSRGPLILAPDATLDAYRGLIASNTRVRVIGLFLLTLGGPTIALTRGGEGGAQILGLFGWLLTVGGLMLELFPSAYRRLGTSALDFTSTSIDSAIVRVLGAIAVGIGGVLVYAGLFAF